jgi:hypothetical protein
VNLLILDTDRVSLLLRGNPIVCDRVLQTNLENLVISIVTAEEICQGWLSEIKRTGLHHDNALDALRSE